MFYFLFFIALKPHHIKNFFDPVFSQAEDLKKAYDSCNPAKKPSFRVPFVTVSALFTVNGADSNHTLPLRYILMRSTHVHALVCSKRLSLIERLMEW